MPIYEYRCRKCGDFETIQRISDAPLTHCPTCRRKVAKLMSSTSFHLKGSGWYVTDYARKHDAPGKDEKKSEANKPGTSDASGAGGSATSEASGSTGASGSSTSEASGSTGSGDSASPSESKSSKKKSGSAKAAAA